MMPPMVHHLLLGIWALVAAIVVGYPLVTGQMRAGADAVRRSDDPQRFWSAYTISTVLFLAVSGGVALVLGRI